MTRLRDLWRRQRGVRWVAPYKGVPSPVTDGQAPVKMQVVLDRTTDRLRLALVVPTGELEVLMPTDAEFAFRPVGSQEPVAFGHLDKGGRVVAPTPAGLAREARRRLADEQARGMRRRNRRRATP